MTAPLARPLPPRPRAWEWWIAGAGAGILLGTAESALGQLSGAPLPARLTLAYVGVAAILCATGAGVLGASVGRGAGRSALAGWVLAPVVALPALTAAARLAVAGESETATLLAVLALVTGGVVGWVASGAAARLEAAGVPIAGWGLWTGAALLVAAAEQAAASGRPTAGLGVGAAALLAALVATAATAWLAPRPRQIRASWGRAAVVLALLTCAVAWLEPLRRLAVNPGRPPAVVRAPASLLAVSLPPEGDEAEDLASWGVATSEALAFAELLEGVAPADLPDVLRLSSGEPLVSVLAASGYATATILRDPLREPPACARELDDRLAAGGMLRRHGARAAAGQLLLAFAPDQREALGLGETLRGPEEVTSSAIAWLADWRWQRARNPFALVVDYGAVGERLAPPGTGAQLAELLEALYLLEADASTFVLVLRSRPGGRTRLALRLPPLWPMAARGSLARDPVAAGAWADGLARSLASPQDVPVWLPGTPVELLPTG